MGQTVLNRPEAHLGAVELEGVKAQGFGGREAVGGRWRARQAFLEELDDGLRPSGGVIATRDSRDPQGRFVFRESQEVCGGESVETAAGDAELLGRLNSG